MSTTPEKTVLITGANAGIGKDVARQLASRPEIARIYLSHFLSFLPPSSYLSFYSFLLTLFISHSRR